MASIKRYELKPENGKQRWSYRVSWRDQDNNPKAKSFSDKDYPTGTGGPLKAAKAWKSQVEAQLSEGRYVDPHLGKVTFSAYSEKWLETVESTKRESTHGAYNRRVNRAAEYIGTRSMNVIDRAAIQALVNGVADSDSAAYARDIYTTVSSIFRNAVDDGVIAKSPCLRIALPEESAEEVIPLTVAQAEALSKTLPDHLSAWPFIQAGLGLRTSELLGMQLKYLDWEKGTYKVDGKEGQLTGTQPDGKPLLGPPKSKAGARVIPVPQRVLAAIWTHLDANPSSHGLVFTQESGRALHRKALSRAWVPAVERSGLPEGTDPTQLRHTYASLLIAGGENPKVIQKRMGHSDIRITFNTYGHLFPESEEKTRSVIDAAFGSERVESKSA